MKNILFICQANLQRSPTAEQLYKNRDDLNVKSAGISSAAKNEVSQDLIDWADMIFVMEEFQQNKVIRKFKNVHGKIPIHNLNIPDEYDYMEKELIEILTSKLAKYLGSP